MRPNGQYLMSEFVNLIFQWRLKRLADWKCRREVLKRDDELSGPLEPIQEQNHPN